MAEMFNIIYLPEHILIQIFSYLSYSEISEKRQVCQAFNRVCSRELTKAFVRVDRLHSQIQKNIKSRLPRKESERRNHALSRFVDVLSAMETRLSLLSMTYTKYIDLDLCCFIPGKVLDEMYRLLQRLQNTNSQPPRSYDLLQALRDLSTMAMEHFEEFIVPILKAQMSDCSQSLYFSASDASSPMQLNPTLGSASFTSSMDMTGVSMLDYYMPTIPIVSTPFRRTPLKLDVQRVQNQMQMHSAAIATMTKEYREQKVKIGEQGRMVAEQERKLQEQALLVGELKAHVQAQEKTVEVLAAHLTAITGKEVPLPEPRPWDHALWELPSARPALPPPSSSSQDNGLSEDGVPVFPYVGAVLDPGSRESPLNNRFRQFVAEYDQGAKPRMSTTATAAAMRGVGVAGEGLRRGAGAAEDDFGLHDPIAYHMNELCQGYSTACATQRLLFQVALLIPSIAANHSLPLCLAADSPLDGPLDPKDPRGAVLHRLTAAQAQLSNLFEEHVGCTQCGDCPPLPHAPGMTHPSYLTVPSTSLQDCGGALYAPPPHHHAALHFPPPLPHHAPPAPGANHALMNRAQELYNRLQSLSTTPLDKVSQPSLPPPPHQQEEVLPAGEVDEESGAEPARGRGKGKGPMKRGRCLSKAKSEAAGKAEASEAEPGSRSRKRRKR